MDYDEFLKFYNSERYKAFCESFKSLTKNINNDFANRINNAPETDNFVLLNDEKKSNLTDAQRLKKITEDFRVLGESEPEKTVIDDNSEYIEAEKESIGLRKFAAFSDMVEFAKDFEKNYDEKIAGASKEDYDLIYNLHHITSEIVSLSEYANVVYDNIEIENDKNAYNKAKSEYREAQRKLDNEVNLYVEKHGNVKYNVAPVAGDKADIDAFSVVFDEALYLDDSKINTMEDNYETASKNAREIFDKNVDAVKAELNKKTETINKNAEIRLDALKEKDKDLDDRLKELRDIIKNEEPKENKAGYQNLMKDITELKNTANNIKLSDNLKKLGDYEFIKITDSVDVKDFDGKVTEINSDISFKKNQIENLDTKINDLTNNYNKTVETEKAETAEYTKKAEEASKNLLYYNTLIADKQLNVSDIDEKALNTDELKNKYDNAVKAFMASNNAYEDFGKALKDNKAVKTVNNDLDKYFTAQQKLVNEINRFKKEGDLFPFDNELPDNISKDLKQKLTDFQKDNNFSAISKEVFVLQNTIKGNIAVVEGMNSVIHTEITDYKQLKNALTDYIKAAKKIDSDLKPYDKYIEDISVQKNNYNAVVNDIYDDFKATRDNYRKEFNECTEKLNSINPKETEHIYNEKKEDILSQKEILNNDIKYLTDEKKVIESGLQWIKEKTEDPVYKAKLELPEAENKVFKKNQAVADAVEKVNEIKNHSLTAAKQESAQEINKIGEKYKAEVKALNEVKKSVDLFNENTKKIKEGCIELKEKAQPLIEAKNNLDTKYLLAKEKINSAHNRELSDFGKKEDSLLKDILTSKKKFGFNSSVFERVKENAQALLDFKKKNPDAPTEQAEALKQKLMNSLDNYIEARGTGSKKLTAEGQHRLDAIKNMKALLENEKKVNDAFEKDKNSLEIDYKTEIEKPKSMLEVNTAFGGKLVNQNIFPDEAIRDTFKVKVDRKIAANKEAESKIKVTDKSVSMPEVKKTDLQKGSI